MRELGISPRETLTTNAIFLRAADQNALAQIPDVKDVWEQACKPAHAYMLSVVKPRVVVCLGIKCWTYFTGRGDPGRWAFFKNEPLVPAGQSEAVLLLPHFARQAAWTKHADEIAVALQEARHF